MPKVSPIYNDFRGGEFSPLMYGRVDLDEYRNGLKECLNMVPIVQGGLISRPGTEYSSNTKNSDKKAVYIPFQYSTVQAYVLEFGENYIRFHMDGGQILETAKNITAITKASPCVVTIAGHAFTTGKEVYISGITGMTQLNGKNFILTSLSADTFSLSDLAGNPIDSTNYTTYTADGTAAQVYEITTTYTEDELATIQYAQSLDVLYLTHQSHAPKTLSRYGHASWTFADYAHTWGPFLDENVEDADVLTVSAVTGAGITITASGGHTPFSADMIGSYIGFRESLESKNRKWEAAKTVSIGDVRYYDGKLYVAASGGTTGENPPVHDIGTESDGAETWTYLRGDRGYAQITAYTSTTVVTATVIERLPDPYLTGWHSWSEGAWSDKNGYPAALLFYDGRLWFGGSTAKPQTIWATVSGSFTDFKPVNASGDVSASEALSLTVDAADVNVIRWLSDEERALMVGTSGGEWIVRPYKIGEVLSATNISVKRSTANGCAALMPVRVDRASVYVQRLGKKVRELAYVYEIDGFRSPDMTIVSEHITGNGITKLALMREPQPIIWAVREDGKLLSFTYDRQQSVLAWAMHDVGGVVESIAVISDPGGGSEQRRVVDGRSIQGASEQFKEIMTVFNGESAGKAYANYSDLSLSVSGTATSSISGFDHLESETLSIWADGTLHPDVVVTSGAITLNDSYSYVVAGLAYTRRVQLLPIEAGAADGTAQGKTKRIHRVSVRLNNTMYLKCGHRVDKMQEVIFRDTEDVMGDSYALFTGDKVFNWGGDYDTEGAIIIENDSPMPMTILAVMPQLVTQDRG